MKMESYIGRLMDLFPNSYINRLNELILYSSENSIIKKLEFSSGGFYSEETYIYALQEIMTEINIGETE